MFPLPNHCKNTSKSISLRLQVLNEELALYEGLIKDLSLESSAICLGKSIEETFNFRITNLGFTILAFFKEKASSLREQINQLKENS
jgi:hypothetical protein